jgi:hypothetical protein
LPVLFFAGISAAAVRVGPAESRSYEAKDAGAWVFDGGFHPARTATVVRIQKDDALVTDGPYVEGKEHVGEFLIVQAADLDAALEWARKMARAHPAWLRGPEAARPARVVERLAGDTVRAATRRGRARVCVTSPAMPS